mgnify:CR=1 FL=1
MVETKEAYEEKIRCLVEPAVEAEGMELVLASCLMMKGRWVVRLYIDKPEGVTIDDCAVVSQLVGDILDVHDALPVAYTLEVSSPGLDRPLVRDKDFLAYRGRRVTVTTFAKIDGSRHFRGILVDYREEKDEKTLWLDVGGQTCAIPRQAVQSARLDPEW